LRAIDLAISSSFRITPTFGILLEQLTRHLGVDAADILTFNTKAMTFKVASERGFRTLLPQQIMLSSETGLAWQAVCERKMVFIPHLEADKITFQKFPDLTVEQFTAYVGLPLISKGQIKGVLEVYHRGMLVFEKEQIDFLEALAGQAAIAMDNSELFENLQSSVASLNIAYDSTLEGWATALELRDKETAGHTRRVAEMTVQLAQAMGVSANDMVHVYRGALLHDIGKMGIPDSIVLKPGALTPEEWEVMRKHPQYALDMLLPTDYLKQALDIPYCHHEKWDGTGYPRGLKGEQIPMAARIFSVVDVWDALTSDRPYRKAWKQDETIAYIKEQAGKQFDPQVVDVFLREVVNPQ
jgi:putative nucleotidyltransferase with HDIG domain